MNLRKNMIVWMLFAIATMNGMESLLTVKTSYKTTDTSSNLGYEKQIQLVDKNLQDVNANIDRVNGELEKILAEITVLKGKIDQARNESTRTIFQRQLTDRNQDYQILTDLEQVYQQTKEDLEQRRKELNEYYADPSFSHLKLQARVAPNFDEVQDVGRNLSNTRQLVNDLEKRKTIYAEDIAKRKKAVDAITLEYQEKQELLSKKGGQETSDPELRQLRYKKELAESKVKEAELRLDLVDAQYMIARKKVSILKDEYARLKRILTIDAAYVRRAEQALEKKRQASVDKQGQLHEKIKLLGAVKEEIRQKLQDLRTRYNLSSTDLTALREWSKTPKTRNEWIQVAQVGSAYAQDVLIDAEREYLEAQIEHEKVRFKQEEIAFSIIKSWHKMTQRKFRSGTGSAIEQDIKSYATPKTELQADLVALTEKRNATINLLHTLNMMLDKIKALTTALKNQKNLLFKDYQAEYTSTLKLLHQAEEFVRRRVDYIAKLIEVYSTTIAEVSQAIKKIEDVVAELGSKGWWQQQSVQAIEWTELKNFIPDLKLFFADISANIVQHLSFEYLKRLGQTFISSLLNLQELLHLLLQIIICVILYILLKLYIPDFRRHLFAISPEYGIFATVSYFIGGVLGFVYERLLGLYIWACIFVFIKFEFISDPFLATLFYLGSIAYLLYLIRAFMIYFIQLNKQRNYTFVSQQYQKRFTIIISFLLVTTTFIFFLREAFLVGNYPTSQVPAILLALNFIVLQVCLLFLISKEQIVTLIPTRTPLWDWIAEHVNKYYYVILVGLIAIIIMSNPYVGYGRQVLYILSRLILTALLIPLFSWLHNRLKRTSSDLFFYYSDGEVIKERFGSAKTWYGFFVVLSFLVFVVIGLIIGGAIWGKSIGLRELYQWLSYELYSPGFNEVTGKKIEITALSLFQIIGFVIGGIILTYIINYFLLRRIFDPLLVGAGVQNTILTLSRYVIIIMAFLIGLQSAGLDAMATKLAVIIGIIGFAIKEPIGDFFSYFIILVQRPISIGDLVMLEPEVMGVVRQITPRSTILRRRNSVTIIVPNSDIITKSVTNWNYTRTFFAFEDIFITVPYAVDAHKIRHLILKVLDENPNILKNPAPIVWLHNFIDNGFQFLVRGYLTADKTLQQWDISSEVRLEIVKRLREEGITIASPTRHIRIEHKDS